MEAAFFDLDKTVIAKASMVAFGRPLLDAGMISRWLVVRAMWSNLLFQRFGASDEKMRKVRESALRITRGWDQARISAIVRENLIEVIEPIVYDEALDLIRSHQAAGRRVFLISASPEEIVAPLAHYLGVDEAIASRASLDGEGRYTGEVEFYSYGPNKAIAMQEVAERQAIDLSASYAYSDSVSDLPMLEAVGHPVAVNPDRDLARTAGERSWEVVHFERSVPLRARVALPAPRKLAVVVTIAAAGAGAAGTWWWLTKRPPDTPSRGTLGWPAKNTARPKGNRTAGRRLEPAASSRWGRVAKTPRGRGQTNRRPTGPPGTWRQAAPIRRLGAS